MMMENSHPVGDQLNEARSPSPMPAWLAVGSVTVGAFAFVTTEFLPVGLLPQIAQEFGVTPGTAGLMVTIPGVMAAISAPGMMLGAGRVDRRYILLILSALLLSSNLISAFAPNFAVMLIGRAILGASLGGFWTLALAAAGRLVQPHEAARATAMILAGVTFATVIGVPFGTFIANLASWRASFIATGILVTVALVAQAILLPSLPSKAALRFADLFALLRRTHPRRSLFMVAFIFGAHFSSYTFIAPFLLQYADFSTEGITWVLLGFGAIGFVSNFAVSATVTRNLKASLATMVLMLMISLLVMPALRHSAPTVVAIVLAWGIAFGAIPLCLSLWIQKSTSDLPEAGSALFVGIIQVAIAVGSSLGGGVVDRVGIPADFELGAVLALVGLAILGSFLTPQKDTGSTSAPGERLGTRPDCGQSV